MNEDKDKLDDLFRKGLEDPVDQTSYRETDWDSLDQMLDKHKKRRGVIYWLPVLGSVAAVLLLFIGWLFLAPKASQTNQPQHQVANHVNQASISAGDLIKPKPNHQPALPDVPNYVNNNRERENNGNKLSFTRNAAGDQRDNAVDNRIDTISRPSAENLIALSYMPVAEQAFVTGSSVKSFDIPRPSAGPATAVDVQKSNNKKTLLRPAYRPQFALTVLAAPDINGVGSFQQSKVGTNVGLMFSAGMSKKFTVSAGVIYSDKPYLTSFANYHTTYKFSVDPINVTTDCRMLDIPLNLGYQLYNKRQNKLSIGTGLSSYVMLNQDFKYNYGSSYGNGPSHYEVTGNYKYLFSVLNLSATYERQLSSKIGLSIQPYLKLPMASIGYSQVRLQTTGVAVGLNWNLNSLTKQ